MRGAMGGYGRPVRPVLVGIQLAKLFEILLNHLCPDALWNIAIRLDLMCARKR